MLTLVCDAAGVPLALLLSCYTGVLLSSTSTPVWSKNPWLGAMFAASAVGTGAGAVSLALEAWSALAGPRDEAASEALQRVDTAAHAAETLTLMGYRAAAGAGEAVDGRQDGAAVLGRHGGAGGVGGAEAAAVARPGTPLGERASAALGLAGGLALRWAFTMAGPPSGRDPEAARRASRPAPQSGIAERDRRG